MSLLRANRQRARLANLPLWARDVSLAGGTGIISLLFALSAWHEDMAQLTRRWSIGDADQVLHYGIFSSALSTFPFVGNPSLGFPASGNLFFAPLFDLWSAIFVSIVGLFTHSGVLALNLYNLGSFVAVGMTSYFFFRALRVRQSISVVFGVAFATLPYHFVQTAIGHPFLGNYWAVPLIGIMVLMVSGRGVVSYNDWANRAMTRRRVIARRMAVIAPLSLIVGLTQSYYFVFACLIVGGVWFVVVITNLLTGRRRSGLLWPTVTLGSLLVIVALQLAVLSLNFADRYEKYFQGRTAGESELYGGRLALLLIPWQGTGVPRLGNIATHYLSFSQVSTASEGPWSSLLGILGVAVAALLILVKTVIARRTSLPSWADQPEYGPLLLGFIWSVLFFSTTGLGVVFSAAVSPEIRAWSRMSIVVELFGIAVLAVVLDRMTRGGRRVWISLAVIGLVVIVDQGLGVYRAEKPAPTADTAVAALVGDVTKALPANCGVVQLPLKGFPESGPRDDMGDYDHFLPYLYSTSSTVRWSYGAVLGTRAGDIWGAVEAQPPKFGATYAKSNACAIWVDLAGYSKHPGEWEKLVSQVADPTEPQLRSSDGRYLVFVTR